LWNVRRDRTLAEGADGVVLHRGLHLRHWYEQEDGMKRNESKRW